ncbi:hypothetical protein AGMMS49587_09210 [Spirochaetia bacterium]|nr:hypothetical protein AGMMS49587_09210 [Spirochaetia bacterium]
MKRFFKVFRGAFALVCFIGAGALASCSTGEAIQGVLGSDSGEEGFSSEAPEFLACKVVSSQEINFQFSRPVQVVSLNFEPALTVDSTDGGATVKIMLGAAPDEGAAVMADILVEDTAGNTLNVLVPFRTRNDRIPKLLITELRTEYSSPRTEFVEFKTLEAGNLGALRLFIPGNTKNPLAFEFPPTEVASGEYVLVHLRTRDTDIGATNETGSELDLSGGNEALADVRDFWVPGSAELLRKTDTVYFMDQDDKVIDAVMLSENPDAWWSKEHYAAAAELLQEQGAWLASADTEIPGPSDAVISGKTTATRSISRDEAAPDTNRASDWYITANNSATPGKTNSTKRLE